MPPCVANNAMNGGLTMMKLLAIGRVCAVFALAALSFTASGHAQPAPAAPAMPACEGEALPGPFGTACLIRAPLPPKTDADYGAVHLRFRPSQAANEIIPESAFRGSWMSRLVQRVANQQVNSAVVLLEVRVAGSGLPANPGANGTDQGVPIALVPLAVYSFENRTNGPKFNLVQDYSDNLIGSRFVLQRDQVVRVRVKISYSHENPASLISSLTPVVNAAAGFGGHGFLVDAFQSQSMTNNLTSIESMLRSVNNMNGDDESWFNLNYDGGPTRLVYDFRLNPRQRGEARNLGRLEVTLQRRASLFTDDVLAPGPDGERRPNYRTGGRYDSQATDRIWADVKIANGMSPGAYVTQNTQLRRDVEELQNAGTSEANFDKRCTELHQDLARFGLSRHDRAAVFWAAFVQGASARRPEIRARPCIESDTGLWRLYGLELPPVGLPPPPIPSQRVVDTWIADEARPALWNTDPVSRVRQSRRLFRNEVAVVIAPNTLYDPNEVPTVTDARVPRDVLVSQLKPLRVACRYVRAEPGAASNLPRFNALGWLNDRVLVLTVDYGGVAGNPDSVQITALRFALPTDADWQAIANTQGIDRQCLRENALRTQSAPAAVQTPATTPPPAAQSPMQPGGQQPQQPTQR